MHDICNLFDVCDGSSDIRSMGTRDKPRLLRHQLLQITGVANWITRVCRPPPLDSEAQTARDSVPGG